MLWNQFQDYLASNPHEKKTYHDFCERWGIGREEILDHNVILQHLARAFTPLDSEENCLALIILLNEHLSHFAENAAGQNRKTMALINNVELFSFEPIIGVFDNSVPSSDFEDLKAIVASSAGKNLTWANFKNKNLFYLLDPSQRNPISCDTLIQIPDFVQDNESTQFYYTQPNSSKREHVVPLQESDINFELLNAYINTIRYFDQFPSFAASSSLSQMQFHLRVIPLWGNGFFLKHGKIIDIFHTEHYQHKEPLSDADLCCRFLSYFYEHYQTSADSFLDITLLEKSPLAVLAAKEYRDIKIGLFSLYVSRKKEIFYVKNLSTNEAARILIEIKNQITDYARENLTYDAEQRTFNTFYNPGVNPARAEAVNSLLALFNRHDTPLEQINALKKLIADPEFEKNAGKGDSHYVEALTSSLRFLKKKGLMSIVKDMKRYLNHELSILSNHPTLALAFESPDTFISYLLTEEHFNSLSQPDLIHLYSFFPKLFAAIVVYFYSEKFKPFTVNHKQITLDILRQIAAIPNSIKERENKNQFLLDLELPLELPATRVYPGVQPEDVDLAATQPEEAYQLTEQDIQCGLHHIISKYPKKFYNQFEGTDNPASKHTRFYLLPINWYNTLTTKESKTLFTQDVLNLLTQESNNPLIVCGILSVGKNHFVPFFISHDKNTSTISIRTINPSAAFYPSNRKDRHGKLADPKMKECEAIKAIFVSLFGDCDYEDVNVTQQLRERHCGVHALNTFEEVIVQDGVTISTEGKLLIDSSTLSVNGNKSQELDPQLQGFFYSQEFNNTAHAVREKWTEIFKGYDVVFEYFLDRQPNLKGQSTKSLSPVSLDSKITLIPVDYSYSDNSQSQVHADNDLAYISKIAAEFLSNENYYLYVKSYYCQHLQLPDLTQTTFYSNAMSLLTKEGLSKEAAHKKIEDIAHNTVRENAATLIENFFNKKITSFIKNNPLTTNQIDIIELFFSIYPDAFSAYNTLSSSQQEELKTRLEAISQEKLAEMLLPNYTKQFTSKANNDPQSLYWYFSAQGYFYDTLHQIKNSVLQKKLDAQLNALLDDHIKDKTITFFISQFKQGKFASISNPSACFSEIFSSPASTSVKNHFLKQCDALLKEAQQKYIEDIIKILALKADFHEQDIISFLKRNKENNDLSFLSHFLEANTLSEAGKLFEKEGWPKIQSSLKEYQQNQKQLVHFHHVLDAMNSLIISDPKIKLSLKSRFAEHFSQFKLNGTDLTIFNLITNDIQDILYRYPVLGSEKIPTLYFVINLIGFDPKLSSLLTEMSLTEASQDFALYLKNDFRAIFYHPLPALFSDSPNNPCAPYRYGQLYSRAQWAELINYCVYQKYFRLAGTIMRIYILLSASIENPIVQKTEEKLTRFDLLLENIIADSEYSQKEKDIAWALLNSANLSHCHENDTTKNPKILFYSELLRIIPEKSPTPTLKESSSFPSLPRFFTKKSPLELIATTLHEIRERHDYKGDFALDFSDLLKLKKFITQQSKNLKDPVWRSIALSLMNEFWKYNHSSWFRDLLPSSVGKIEHVGTPESLHLPSFIAASYGLQDITWLDLVASDSNVLNNIVILSEAQYFYYVDINWLIESYRTEGKINNPYTNSELSAAALINACKQSERLYTQLVNECRERQSDFFKVDSLLLDKLLKLVTNIQHAKLNLKEMSEQNYDACMRSFFDWLKTPAGAAYAFIVKFRPLKLLSRPHDPTQEGTLFYNKEACIRTCQERLIKFLCLFPYSYSKLPGNLLDKIPADVRNEIILNDARILKQQYNLIDHNGTGIFTNSAPLTSWEEELFILEEKRSHFKLF